MKARIALVTGGMGGIGTAICRRLGADGHTVIANCLPGYDRKEAWLAHMREQGVRAFAAEGRVEDFDSCAAMIQTLRSTIGPIEMLINNAGITRDGLFRRMSQPDWRDVIEINLNSVFNATRPVIEQMLEGEWGRVVNISSVNALKGQFGQANYCAAKAGMHGFSKALAQEVAKKGITVNTVSPGYVDTEMVRAMKPEALQQISASIPVGRLARPEEIAGLVAYLVSEEAAYITGANISINGGLHME